MTEATVQPLVKSAKKRPYRRPSHREIFQRCVKLSREIREGSAGKGFDRVFLRNVTNHEGRVWGVDIASSAETRKAAESGLKRCPRTLGEEASS